MDKKTFKKEAIKFILVMIAFAVMIILLSSGASAFEFDNIKYYNETDRSITVRNSFLGIIGLDSIAKITPLTPHVNPVLLGKDRLVAEFRIESYLDYNEKVWDGMKFYNLKNGGTEFQRELSNKYLDHIEKTISPQYETQCKESEVKDKNGTFINDCTEVYVGNITSEKKIWINLDENAVLPKGELIVGVFTDVESGDYVEFVPTWFGVEMPEYSVWTDSLNVGLVAVWKMNENLGTNVVENKYGIHNGTLAGTWTTGIIGSATNYSETTDVTQVDTTLNMLDQNITIIAWVYAYAGFGDEYIIQKRALLAGSEDGYAIQFDSSTVINCHFFDNEKFTIQQLPNQAWVLLSCMYNTNGTVTAWVNGTVVGVGEVGVDVSQNNANMLTIGNRHDFTEQFAGRIDNVYIYNRTLTAQEQSDFYNNGAGIEFPSGATDQYIDINQTAPANNSVFAYKNVSLNFSITVVNATVKNYTLNVYNYANGSIFHNHFATLNTSINQTINHSDVLYADGKYKWDVTACATLDNSSTSCDYAGNKTFTVDTTFPTFNIFSPTGNLTTLSLPVNVTLYVNTTDANIMNCSYFTNENATPTYYPCNTSQNVSFNNSGYYTITVAGNDTAGNYNTTSISYLINFINSSIAISPSALMEGGSFTTYFNITATDIQQTNASVLFNNTIYPMTQNFANTTVARYSLPVSVPFVSGDTLFNVSVLYYVNGIGRYSDNRTLTVYNLSIGDCSVIAGTNILNLSIKDEELNTLLNITTPNTDLIEIDLTLTDKSNPNANITFSADFVDKQNVSICIPNLTSPNFKWDFTIGYEGTDHVREFYYMENGTLDATNFINPYTTKQINLMDLLTADSTTFLFEFTDEDGLEVEDIIVHTFRKYIGEGLFREVERSKQDNSGQTHVHLVEEDVIYYFMITQYGNIIFTSDTYNAKCLSTPCEISLSASATSQNWSIIDNEGGQYTVTSSKATRVATTTFSINAVDLVNVSLYEMIGGIPVLINTTSVVATSGSLPLHVPIVYGNNSFFVSIYRNNTFVKSEWVDLTENAQDYFGTFGAILGGLIVLALMLMAVSEGVGFVVFTILALIIVGAMKLVDLGWLALISIICAGGIIVWKLVNRRGTKQ